MRDYALTRAINHGQTPNAADMPPVVPTPALHETNHHLSLHVHDDVHVSLKAYLRNYIRKYASM